MSNKIVLVTGVSGILGNAVAQHLNMTGWQVLGVDYAREPADETALHKFYGGIDLTDKNIVDELLKNISKDFDTLQAVVNVAGGFKWETLRTGDIATWEAMWQINLKTCLNVCMAALDLLDTNTGSIVNIGAAATERAGAGMSAYTSSKSAVARLTEGLAAELANTKLRVNAVLPTILDTPLNRSDMPDEDFTAWVSPADLAKTIGFLVSVESGAIHGALIPVRGRL